ncbi:hypothetical protein [Sulfuriferula plumbiphila]|uniref:hypothetical protein n=1 Tax=Sulfuriferula plumbiphila TaxID=171865 RepID=UPI0011BF147A|nr:hypothetical protein [Sulfuriferula plumbiphila]
MPVKDRYRDSGDVENKISSWGKMEHVAANDSAFRRASRFAEKLLMDACATFRITGSKKA